MEISWSNWRQSPVHACRGPLPTWLLHTELASVALGILRSHALAAVLTAILMAPLNAQAIGGGSSLLTQAHLDQLEAWLGEGPIRLNKIYAKQPGHIAADFHAAVDGKGRTFTVIELLANRLLDYQTGQYDNPAQIVGGYNPQSWRSSLVYGPSAQNITLADEDRKAFIFNLTTLEIQRQRLTAQDTASLGPYQTYNYILHGPSFGSPDVQADIFIDNGLDNAVFYNHSYGEKWLFDNILAGSSYYHFGGGALNPSVGAIEVFSIVAVPEPASVMLALLGLGAIDLRRRLRNPSPPRRNRFERLEDRSVFSATCGSAVNIVDDSHFPRTTFVT